MDIPEKLTLRNTLHGHGAKGMAIYGYADTLGLGVRMEARRADRRSRFVETWFLDALPGREFASFKALCEAALPLTDEQVAAATSDVYPQIRDVAPDSCGNRCRLCPRPPGGISDPRAHHTTWSVTLMYSWKDGHPLSLCAEHLQRYQADPKGLRVAVEAELAERRARAEANELRRADNNDSKEPPHG